MCEWPTAAQLGSTTACCLLHALWSSTPSFADAAAELKQALALAGIASEFHAGALYCAGQVVVRRRAAESTGGGDGVGGGGGLVLEGALSEDYFRIREIIYAQYHIC